MYTSKSLNSHENDFYKQHNEIAWQQKQMISTNSYI